MNKDSPNGLIRVPIPLKQEIQRLQKQEKESAAHKIVKKAINHYKSLPKD